MVRVKYEAYREDEQNRAKRAANEEKSILT
jgi:hypothetical protein